MDVSVIIPLYNGARWIRDTIESVLAQTHPPREIVVVDDGSEDNSPALVQETFPEVTLVHCAAGTRKGAGTARSLGFRHTSAPLVAFLDQDDLWHPCHLRSTSRLLRNNTYPAALAQFDRFRDSSTPDYSLTSAEVDLFSPWDGFPLNRIHSPSGAVIRRSALNRIGGWPVQFTISDVNAWFKLTAETPMLQTNKVTVGKRVHGESFLDEIRGENPRSYLQDFVQAAENALTFRKMVRSEPEELYQNRLDVFTVIANALADVRMGNPDSLRDAARFLEEEARISQSTIGAFWSFGLRLFSFPRSQIAAVDVSKHEMLLRQIIAGWPSRYGGPRRTLAQALTQSLSYRAFLAYLLDNPIAANTSLLFLECMKMQAEKATRKSAGYFRRVIHSAGRVLAGQMRIDTAPIE